MKKINYIALASLAAAITAVSCSKEEMQSSAVSEGTVLAASIAQAPDTKTAMSGATEGSTVSIVWSAGDKLSVLSGASFGTNNEFTLKSGDEGKTSGSFTGANISGDIIAVYPYSSDVAYSTDKVTLNIPKTQAYTNATFAQNSIPMVAKGTVGTPLTFNYLFSAIAFKIVGTGKNVTKITVAATTPLWGPAEISNLDATPIITMTGTDSKYYTVELTCATAQDITSDKVFYIAVPAGTYSFAVNVYCGSEVFHQSYTTAKTFTIGSIKYNSTAKVFTDNGPAYVDGSYIGEGTKIGSTWWAPVNCGYDATNYKYGKLYQWGRHDGCGYNDGTAYKETLIQAKYPTENTQVNGTTVTENANYFYCGSSLPRYDWLATQDDARWNGGSEEAPVRTDYDPCPAGWRVPTGTELSAITSAKLWTTTGGPSSDQNGYLFGTSPNQVFFPAAGYRDFVDDIADNRGSNGNYWSSSPGTNNTSCARDLGSVFSYFVGMGDGSRAAGFSVRCVQE